MTVISYAARSSARPDVEKSTDGIKSCSPSCVVHELYEPASSSVESRCWVKLDRREFVSSESDFVLERPMTEADPLTMLLNKCKPFSVAVTTRVALTMLIRGASSLQWSQGGMERQVPGSLADWSIFLLRILKSLAGLKVYVNIELNWDTNNVVVCNGGTL